MLKKDLLPVYVVSLFIIAIPAVICGYKYQKQKSEKEYRKAVLNLRSLNDKYDLLLKEELPKAFGDMMYIESLDIDGSIRYIEQPDAPWDDINVYYSVAVHADDYFDLLIDNRQYEYLCDLCNHAEEAFQHILDEKFPELEEAKKALEKTSRFRLGRNLFQKVNNDFYVITSSNTYQYADKVKDYYLLNGKDHFTQKHRDEQQKKNPTRKITPAPNSTPKSTPAPKRKKESSGKGKKKVYNGSDDPYEVDEYDDPEDFWEDHEDEFEDYEDAEDYWEENH